MKKLILSLNILLIGSIGIAQNVITINPVKDNAIYSESGSLSNGAGDFLYIGRTNQGDNRRALVKFDIAGALQSGDSIIDVSLKMQCSKVGEVTTYTFNIHKLSTDWGEGTSDAGDPGGMGATATAGDATWSNAFFGGMTPIAWANAGGDFDSNASASFTIGGQGAYSASGGTLKDDVSAWLLDPSTNNGWIIIGDEAVNKSAKRINSRENTSGPLALEITYSSPVSLAEKLESDDVRISPNPVETAFALDDVNEFESLQIIDLNGKFIKEFTMVQERYDISDLPRGIYLLKVSDNQTNVTKKIVKK